MVWTIQHHGQQNQSLSPSPQVGRPWRAPDHLGQFSSSRSLHSSCLSPQGSSCSHLPGPCWTRTILFLLIPVLKGPSFLPSPGPFAQAMVWPQWLAWNSPTSINNQDSNPQASLISEIPQLRLPSQMTLGCVILTIKGMGD